MLLTIFLAMVFCMAVTVLLIAAVAFVQKERFFSSAPKEALAGRKYGFNIKSQLLKLLVIFPAVSAIAAWICSLIG